jgi:hypothetical protein
MFRWSVILADGTAESGVVATLEEALTAIRDWYGKGDGKLLGDQLYIIRTLTSEEVQA